MIKIKQWIIMSKDRKYIATGVPRNRKLVKVEDYKNERILTYKSKGMAESGFKHNWFYGVNNLGKDDMEAVLVEVNMTEITE